MPNISPQLLSYFKSTGSYVYVPKQPILLKIINSLHRCDIYGPSPICKNNIMSNVRRDCRHISGLFMWFNPRAIMVIANSFVLIRTSVFLRETMSHFRFQRSELSLFAITLFKATLGLETSL
jgi:hypothetical protein